MDRTEKWRHLEAALTQLVSSMSAQLGERDRQVLAEFIDNREYGVALDWLHSLMAENGLSLSGDQENEIRRLAELMGIDLAQP